MVGNRGGSEEGGRRGRRREPDRLRVLPKREVDQIKETLASYAAARGHAGPADTTDRRGKAALRAMKTRARHGEERLNGLFEDVSPTRGSSRVAVTRSRPRRCVMPSRRPPTDRSSACSRSSARRQRRTGARSSPRSRDGAPDALDAVGHQGEPTPHPVCKEVLAAISPGGTKGSDLQKRFAAPPSVGREMPSTERSSSS